MKRRIVLGTLVLAGGLVLAVAAFVRAPVASAQQPAPMVIEVEKLRDNLFVLRGGGGNTAVFIQATGVTVVDTKNPGWGEPILAKIRELTNKPVTTIVNTHTHGDHVSGNAAFADSVDIVTHVNTAAHMKQLAQFEGPPNGPAQTLRRAGARAMPDRTFTDTMTLGTGNDRVELHYFGRGHTDGDAWVLFPAARVLHAGDIFPGKQFPLLDYGAGGSGVQIGDSLMKAYTAMARRADSIVTGHSTVMTPEDLRQYAEFNRELLDTIREAKKSGKAVDEVVTTWTMPARYAGYAAPQPARLRLNTELIYNEIR